MTDIEFQEFWESLERLHFLGLNTAIFNKDKEFKIRNGIEDRYGVIERPDVYLCNVKLIFI